MASFIRQLQQEIADRLSADPAFADIPIIVADEGDISYQIENALSGLGQFVLVLLHEASCKSPDSPGPEYDPIKVRVECTENRALRRDGAGAMAELAEKAAQLLHHWKPASLSACLSLDSPALVFDVQESVVTWALNLTTQGVFGYELPVVDDVEITVADDEVTLSCTTPGAAIFYTTNGKHAAPRNGTLYAAPFAAPASGTTLKARAWLAGYETSIETKHVF